MTEETVNPAVLELIELGNGRGGIRVDGNSREETHANIQAALERSKRQYRDKATRPHEPLSSELLDRVATECFEHFTEEAKQRSKSE